MNQNDRKSLKIVWIALGTMFPVVLILCCFAFRPLAPVMHGIPIQGPPPMENAVSLPNLPTLDLSPKKELVEEPKVRQRHRPASMPDAPPACTAQSRLGGQVCH